jgi:D-xylose transport system permease protein
MSDVARTEPATQPARRTLVGRLMEPIRRVTRPIGRLTAPIGRAFAATEVNLRIFGMVVALLVILLGFSFADRRLLDAANLVTFSVQAAAFAIIAMGMVLVIVSRNIDLSVGSQVGVLAMVYALLMSRWLPELIGFNNPYMWIVALAIGIVLGALIGGFQGFIVAYIGVPSFVVTLGGLLALRGVVWLLSSGASVSGLDPTFQVLGGGPRGSIGGTASWILGALACLAIVGFLAYNRWQRRRFGFPLRPRWAEVLIGTVGIIFVLGAVSIANAYYWPARLAATYAQENNIPVPEGGLRIESGVPWPLLVVVIVAVLMTFLATRRRFGRYVYAIGGNPEAAELGGINSRWTIMKTFALMGVLCAIAAAIAAARINGSTLDVGRTYELYVIAAAVIGGTSFAGGIGTIPGAVLGALVMASLSYGLSFLGYSSPVQDIVAGVVLVLAVGFDAWNRRRGA